MIAVREPAVAGLFYPAEKKELQKQVRAFLKGKPAATKGKLKALIVPHAGYVYSGGVAGKGFQLLKGLNPKTEWEFILLGPSHTVAFEGAGLSQAEKWKTPLGTVFISKRANEFLSPFLRHFENAHGQEHCLEVQLPFLQEAIEKFSIIPIVAGEIDSEALAIELESKLTEKTVFIASSDLSHYLSYEKAVEKDQATIQAILELDIEKMEKNGDACGKTPILVLMHIAKQKNWKPVLLEYKNSGDTAGDKKRVVGYVSIAFTEQ
jgi:AmmeMemoRadiSam system protein B